MVLQHPGVCRLHMAAAPPTLFFNLSSCCFVISDQQHSVLCLAAHINVFVPPVRHPFQQRDIPHMDSAGRGW